MAMQLRNVSAKTIKYCLSVARGFELTGIDVLVCPSCHKRQYTQPGARERCPLVSSKGMANYHSDM